MRVGIIGLGSIGTRHAKNALALGHECAGYDNGKRAIWYEDAMGRLTSMDDVVDYQPCAVLICTPAATHAAVATELLALGYRGPLFCEKPLALSVADCEVFRDWPHPTTMVGYNLRFHPIARALKQMGGWTHGMLTCNCDNRKYGNDLFELSHELDLALWLGVPPRPDFLDGQASAYGRGWLVDANGVSVGVHFSSPTGLGTQMYVDEIAHFLDCAAKVIPTITPFADGIRVVQVCEDAVKLANA